MKRTDFNGNLRKEDVGRTVSLRGWIAKARNLGGLLSSIFATLAASSSFWSKIPIASPKSNRNMWWKSKASFL